MLRENDGPFDHTVVVRLQLQLNAQFLAVGFYLARNVRVSWNEVTHGCCCGPRRLVTQILVHKLQLLCILAFFLLDCL